MRAKVEIEFKCLIPPSVTDPSSYVVMLVRKVAKEVLGFEPKLFVNSGRYDSVFYVMNGAEAMIYCPGAKGVAHAVNEYVPITELDNFVKIYYELFKKISQ